jgi:hypothetical protein
MTDFTNPQPATRSAPPSSTVCGFCRRPIADQYFEFMGKICCPPCAQGVVKLGDLHQPDAMAMMRAAAFGIGAAIASGVVWAIVAAFGHMELGILAVGVGWSVAAAIKAGSGGRRGPHMQFMAVAIALLGILFGKLLTAYILLSQRLPPNEAIHRLIVVLHDEPTVLFTAFDLIWCFIAILRPFQTFKTLNIRIRGPFSLSTGPMQALQFDRANPTAPPPAGPEV